MASHRNDKRNINKKNASVLGKHALEKGQNFNFDNVEIKNSINCKNYINKVLSRTFIHLSLFSYILVSLI